MGTLESKLAAERIESGHIKFRVYDFDGTLVGFAHFSRSWDDIDDNLMSLLAKTLNIPTRFWAEVCRCTYGRRDYLNRVQR